METINLKRWIAVVLEGCFVAACSIFLFPQVLGAKENISARRTALKAILPGKELFRFTRHEGNIAGVAFSPDGKLLAAATEEKIVLWDVASGKKRALLTGHRLRVTSISFAPDSKTLASGSDDKTIRLWKTATGKEYRQLAGHAGPVMALVFSPDGKTLASTGQVNTMAQDNTIRVWQTSTGKEVRRWQEPLVQAIAFSPDGQTLTAGQSLFSSFGMGNGFGLAGFGGGLVGAGGGLGGGGVGFGGGMMGLSAPVRRWNLATGKEGRPFYQQIPGSAINALAFSPSGRTVAIGSKQSAGLNGLGMGGIQGPGALGCGIFGFGGIGGFNSFAGGYKPMPCMSGFGGFQGMGLNAGFCLCETAAGKERWRVTGQLGDVLAIAFSTDGNLVAAGIGDGTILVCRVATGEQLCHFSAHKGMVNALLFPPDGKHLLSCGQDGSVWLWEVAGLAAKRQQPTGSLTDKELKRLWSDLGHPEAGPAFQAMKKLAVTPRQTLPLIQQALQVIASKDDPRHVEKLLADLESRRYVVRRDATAALEHLEEFAEPALRLWQQSRDDLEVWKRLETILRKRECKGSSADYLRALRALEILEQMDTRAARQLFTALAKGPEKAWLTQEAKAAMRRLR